MKPQDFIAWRKRMGWTQAEAAEQLGLTSRAVQNIEAGEVKQIKRGTRLAMTAIALNLPPYDELPVKD